jgi:hypothetical protein
MGIKLEIDVNSITAAFNEAKEEITQDILKGIDDLAAITHARITEMAEEKLGEESREIFDKAFHVEEIAPHVHLFTIDESAMWIEDGAGQRDMKPDILKSGKAKTNPRTGAKSLSVPFHHEKAPSKNNAYAQSLVSQIKSAMKAKKIPWNTIQKSGGNPRLGKLYEFNLKDKSSFVGRSLKSKANTPILARVGVYQREATDALTGKKSVKREIMTFRTVTSGAASEGKFIHPGYKGQHFFEQAYIWALKEWETNVLPQILSKHQG